MSNVAPITKIKLELEPEVLDFAVRRMTTGTMTWQESQMINRFLAIVQEQANNPAIQGRVERSPQVNPKIPGPPKAIVTTVAAAAEAAAQGEGNDQPQSAA